MPGILDSFVVMLGWDTSQYEEGSDKIRDDQKKHKEESRRTAKEVEEQARKVGVALDTVRREALRMLTVFTAGAGLTEFIANTVKADAQTGRLARQIGVATDELSAWQGVAKRNGGTAEDAVGALQGITRAFEELQLTGNSDKVPYLQTLGISLRDLQQPSEVLLKLADKLSRMDPRRAEALGRGLGLSPTMISTLTKGRAAVEKMLAEQRRLGVVTEADARAAQRLQDVWEGLKDGSSRLGRNVLTALAPVLEAVGRILQDLTVWAQKNAPVVQGAVMGLVGAFALLALSMLEISVPLLAIIGGAIALGAAVGWIAQHIDEFPELKAAVQELGAAFDDVVKAVQDLIDSVPPEVWRAIGSVLRDSVLSVITGIGDALRIMAGLLKTIAALIRGDFAGAWDEFGKTGGKAIDGLKRKLEEAKGLFRHARDALQGKDAPKTPAGQAVDRAGASLTDTIVNTIKKFEGYRANAYWDVNAHRAGYGSDTLTDPKTGRVTRVTKDTKGVTGAQAEADLRRRVTSEFTPKVQKQVGPAWNGLDDRTKAALVSMAYNYGSLPNSVANAARTGDRGAIAAAITARGTDNAGVNAGRRMQEAAMVTGGAGSRSSSPTAGVMAAARAAPSRVANDNRSNSTTIQTLIVQTQATDATGIARAIVPALKRENALATQANTGVAG